MASLIIACGPASVPVLSATPSPTSTVAPTATIAATGIATPAISPTPDMGITIGESVEGRPIKAYRFGDGPLRLLMIGGIHGGYEGNTVALAGAMIDHYTADPSGLDGVSLLIVPDANPDAVAAFDAAGGWLSAQDTFEEWRTNAHGVDLNRNWNCRWQPSGVWSGGSISGGDSPFSEPETRALRDLIFAERPAVVVFWHSALGAVLGGGCGNGSAFDASKSLANAYARAAGYNQKHGNTGSGFTAYAITGDASNWVSRQGIPSLTVELSTHELPEFAQNLAGVNALIDYFRR